MKILATFVLVFGMHSVYANSIESNINVLANRINSRVYSAYKLSQDEKISLVKALNNADAILARVADDTSEPTNPTPPGRACYAAPIAELSKAYELVKNFAYSVAGLNMNTSQAEVYAREWTKIYSCVKANTIAADYKIVRDFAYAVSGLNMNTVDATTYAGARVSRLCPNISLQTEFKTAYDFAYSIGGLNMNSTDARNYSKARLEDVAFSCPF